MPRHSLSSVRTTKRFSPIRASKRNPRIGFETAAAARSEDELRCRSLDRTAKRATDRSERRAWERAVRRIAVSQSLASAVHMRKQRSRICGELWRLADSESDIAVFTLISQEWEVPAGALDSVNPKRFMKTLLNDLYRSGAANADGWLFAALHGEFDPVALVWRLHIHGIAARGMIDVVDGFRNRPKYRRRRGADGLKVARPVRIDRGPLTDMPLPITYLLQPFWPSRWNGGDGDALGIPTRGARRRLPEPYHAQWLRWLDQWAITDVTMAVKLSTKNKRLVVNQFR